MYYQTDNKIYYEQIKLTNIFKSITTNLKILDLFISVRSGSKHIGSFFLF